MSVVRMVGLASDRQVQIASGSLRATVARGGEAETTATGTDTKAVDSALDKLTAFIPSEIIAFYLTGVAMFTNTAATGVTPPPDETYIKWILFFVGSGLIPVIMLISYCLKVKKQTPVPPRGVMFVLFIFALISFAAWVAVTPGTPFETITPYATKIGGLAVIPLAAIMWGIAELCDAVPK